MYQTTALTYLYHVSKLIWRIDNAKSLVNLDNLFLKKHAIKSDVVEAEGTPFNW